MTAGEISALHSPKRGVQWVWQRLNAAEADGVLVRNPYAGHNKADLWNLFIHHDPLGICRCEQCGDDPE